MALSGWRNATVPNTSRAIQNEGARTIKGLVDADNAANMQPGRGVISPATAVAETAKAIEETGYMPTPAERTLLNRVNNASFLTLDEAVKLRSTIGNAASKAERTGNVKGAKVLWTNYDELGKAAGERATEVGGPDGTKAWAHYNNEFKAYFELNKGIAGEMQ